MVAAVGRDGARLRDQLPGDPRRRSDPADGDARHRSVVFSSRQPLLDITGGFDGLQGIVVAPLLGRFEFDLFGKVGFIDSLSVLFVLPRN